MHAALPLVLLLFWHRGRREPLYRQRIGERFGFGPVAPHGCIWIFAASLGETRAVSPLVREFLAHGHMILLTHSSAAGLREGQRLFDDPGVIHRYVPLDLNWAVRRMLRRARPALGLIVESELWPAQLLIARRLGIPMAQVNGNLLDRTITRDAGRFGGARLELLQLFSIILTKSEVYRARYIRAGVCAQRILIVGELKFDQAIEPKQIAFGRALKADAWGAAPILLIASSVEAEEQMLLTMLRELCARSNALRIIWAPRSPQRFDAVAKALNDNGISFERRAQLTPDQPPKTDVLLADSLGEMNIWYAAADLVFVGGSLVNHGGHNIVEPLALCKPVVMGDSIFGITFPAHEAIAAGALRIFPDASALSAEIADLIENPTALAAMTRCAEGFNDQHKGASRRSLAALKQCLEN
ncbi:3-deoxy-D-manno-octulosonic acid transferase [Oceaniglobus ichthyenteri]|uniref:3-deoxy-D-manno-octulosonic acid transferase n=1 Tax=Oceaniglobus ichthyenteri TaxID=2136177 RepID=UPI0013DE1AE4|nr:glycosyltransferase N-terminal domain-containing protein [Oceaniglobus ichthyenteri]